MRLLWFSLALALALGLLHEARCADVDPLDLPASVEQDPPPVAGRRQMFVELGLTGVWHAREPETARNQRVSVDVGWNANLMPGLRGVVSDRLDLNTHDQVWGPRHVNTLREAYLSMNADSRWIADVGRMNLYNGVGLGYNPTDFFRDGALRSIVSADPTLLRSNRMGTVALRGQWLWDNGSVGLAYSPRLGEASKNGGLSVPSDAVFDPDFGATNNRDRWLLQASHRFSPNFNPQVLVCQEKGQPLRLGTNLSVLLGDAFVGYLEWSGGRYASQRAELEGNAAASRSFRQRATLGMTYTTEHRLSLSTELEYNGAGLAEDEWRQIAAVPAASLAYRARMQWLQERPTRRAVFFAARRTGVADRFDLAGLVQLNVDDRSRMTWLEGTWRLDPHEAVVQIRHLHGDAGTEFGALPNPWTVQLLFRYHF